jgi:hypothetical protein
MLVTPLTLRAAVPSSRDVRRDSPEGSTKLLPCAGFEARRELLQMDLSQLYLTPANQHDAEFTKTDDPRVVLLRHELHWVQNNACCSTRDRYAGGRISSPVEIRAFI